MMDGWGRRILALTVMLIVLGNASAWAGATADYQADYAVAWGHYRDAFHQSAENQSDAVATGRALRAFMTAWADVRRRWAATPPPQYGEDPAFAAELTGIAEIASQAARQLDAGRLDQAHVTLAQIRSLLAEMRSRNGLTAYADELDAFDDKLAETADADFDADALPADQKMQMVEQVAVLGYLAERLETHAPQALADDADFVELVEEVNRQVRGLRAAVMDERRAAVVAALSDLRRTFDQLYVRYG